jgi:hypothetical protein
MKKYLLSTLLLAGLVSAQFGEIRRGTMKGSRGGDKGKCTIEVEVDDEAEVEVNGDQGRIRTLSGQPATWRRMECSDPLPRNPVEFEFKGIDGRGDVALVRDPRQNRGTAVVRIRDSKGGREGYTFDLEWSGDAGGRTGGFGRSERGRRDNDGFGRERRDDRYDRGRDNRYTLTCEADGDRRQYCEADTRRGVRMLRGSRECREGSTWGYDGRGVWVDRGCRAEFEVGR